MLRSSFARDSDVGEVEVRVLAVTKLSPGRSFRAMEANLFQHVFSAYAVKGISKVYQQEPLVVDVDVGVVIKGAGGMNYALSGSSDPDPKLERREIVGGVCCCFSRHAFGGPAPDCLSDCNWPVAASLFQSSEEVATA